MRLKLLAKGRQGSLGQATLTVDARTGPQGTRHRKHETQRAARLAAIQHANAFGHPGAIDGFNMKDLASTHDSSSESLKAGLRRLDVLARRGAHDVARSIGQGGADEHAVRGALGGDGCNLAAQNTGAHRCRKLMAASGHLRLGCSLGTARVALGTTQLHELGELLHAHTTHLARTNAAHSDDVDVVARTLLVAICRLRNLAGRLRRAARQPMDRQHLFNLHGIFWGADAPCGARPSHDGKACSHGMAMRNRKVTQQLDGMGSSMAQVEQLALACLTLVGLHHVALDGHAAFHNATFLARKGALQPLKELGVAHDAVLHNLAHAVAHKLARQGLETA